MPVQEQSRGSLKSFLRAHKPLLSDPLLGIGKIDTAEIQVQESIRSVLWTQERVESCPSPGGQRGSPTSSGLK